jgi:DNA invertase Pin-like site-specific DNA recombinase
VGGGLGTGLFGSTRVARKPSVDVVRVKELRDSGMGASAIAKELGIGRASVYRALG